ncbi:hypothetical protein [Sorangium sp. So ce131]|uniref:hypothetical protein n=1 Tax=Sorangium sp. So ce131 TaxID=3133282 RepID=UPI003F648819
MMRLTCWTAGLLAAAASLIALESSADACGASSSGLQGTLPESGATYPANAAIFFEGYDISLEGVSVTVDGEPARLVAVPDVLAGYTLAGRIEPTPGKGQGIVIEGDFCAPEPSCGVTRIELTAGDPDTTAPPAPAALSFDVYQHAAHAPNNCESPSSISWWITAAGEAAGAGESPVIYKVEGFRDDTFTELAFSWNQLVEASPVEMNLRATRDVLGGTDAPEALCFRIQATDAAGNAASGAVHACKPCNYRTDPEGAGPIEASPPDEPEWTSADRYPGGTCAPGEGAGAGGDGGGGGEGDSGDGEGEGDGGAGDDGGSLDDDTIVRGCSCRAAGSDGAAGGGALGGAALALLAWAALVGRRKR